MASRKSVTKATLKPCKDCPWRASNFKRKPDPHKFYTLANLRRLWRGLRNGERMTCHPTDPEMAEFEGYEKTADREVTHECAGALILVQRELMRFQAEFPSGGLEPSPQTSKEALRAYREHHPKGLTKVGLYRHMMTAVFGGTPLTGNVMAKPNLNTEGIAHPDLVPWTTNETAQEVEING